MRLHEREEWYRFMVHVLSQKLGVHTEFKFNNSLTEWIPNIEEAAIVYSHKLDILCLLKDAYFFREDADLGRLTNSYFLAVRLLQQQRYAECDHCLDSFERHAGQLNDALESDDTLADQLGRFRDFQCLFYIYHEFIHRVYNDSSTFRDACERQTIALIGDIYERNVVGRVASWILSKLSGSSVNHTLNDPTHIEELSCDLSAWKILLDILSASDFSEAKTVDMCVGCILALHFLEEIILLNDICSKTDYKHDSKLSRSLQFSTRIYVLEHCIRLNLHSRFHGKLEAYETQLTRYEKRKTGLRLQALQSLRHVGYNLRKGATSRDESRLRASESRLRALENSIEEAVENRRTYRKKQLA